MRNKILVLLILIAPPAVTLAAEVKTFQTIPFLQGNLSTEGYIQALYTLAILTAAIVAVGKLMYAGTKYMFSEKIPSKSSAKADIQNAILGLLIVLGAVTILNTINPNLTNLNVIGKGPGVDITPSERTSSDSVNFSPGQTREIFYVNLYCNDATDPDSCRTQYVEALRKSCALNKGALQTQTGMFGSTSGYACEAGG